MAEIATQSMTAHKLALLGATGSVGTSTLDVVARHRDRFEVWAVAAHRSWQKLLNVCIAFRPRFAALVDRDAADELEAALRERSLHTHVFAGTAGLEKVATMPDVDTVVAAIVGAVGLTPTIAAARAGKRILLANKEALVVGGSLFMAAASEGGATLLPIDSEHNAISQCLPSSYAKDPRAAGIRRLLLTASGGPFRTRALDTLHAATPAEACAHPNWVMGRKISVDSATMMNKALEIIEAHRLFGVPAEAIDIIIHPQSVVHSLVEYVDGSVLAQLGHPDMRTPIAQALAYPDRVEAGVPILDLAARGRLDFEALDSARFPCVQFAYQALAAGDYASVTLNAANEVAVAAFLSQRVSFTAIPHTIATVLDRTSPVTIASVEDAIECDQRARSAAAKALCL